jgi:lysophospholipase
MPRRDETPLSSADGTSLYFESTRADTGPRATVAIVHGFGDHIGRYRHVIDGLAAAGFDVFGFDYRGHGKAQGKRGDVEQWVDYLADLNAFWSQVSVEAKTERRFVLAHSHGALMAAHWAAQHPKNLAGLVFSGPYFRLAFEPPTLKLLGAKVLRRVAPRLAIATGLTVEQLSSDAGWQASTTADPLYGRVITARSFFGQLAAQEGLVGLGPSLKLPLLTVMGEADPIASLAAARAFFDTVGAADKTFESFAGLRHEVLNEVQKDQVLSTITKWISAHASSTP